MPLNVAFKSAHKALCITLHAFDNHYSHYIAKVQVCHFGRMDACVYYCVYVCDLCGMNDYLQDCLTQLPIQMLNSCADNTDTVVVALSHTHTHLHFKTYSIVRLCVI